MDTIESEPRGCRHVSGRRQCALCGAQLCPACAAPTLLRRAVKCRHGCPRPKLYLLVEGEAVAEMLSRLPERRKMVAMTVEQQHRVERFIDAAVARLEKLSGADGRGG